MRNFVGLKTFIIVKVVDDRKKLKFYTMKKKVGLIAHVQINYHHINLIPTGVGVLILFW